MTQIHPAIQEELDILRSKFPDKQELTLDEYADYFNISRRYAAQHFSRVNKGSMKIAHKRIGKIIRIPLIDFAYWLAQHKLDLRGRAVVLPSKEDLRNKSKHDYRRVG